MTKRQYETNNKLNNVEMALMDKTIGTVEKQRLRRIQASLIHNLKATEK